MAMAYTPGLKRKDIFLVRKTRRLPIPGEVIVKKGDKVTHTDTLATTNVPGNAQLMNCADLLGLLPDDRTGSCDFKQYMLKKEGDKIEKGEMIALKKEFFGLIKRPLMSPLTGSIELISDSSGQLILREPPVKVNINSYIPGTIAEVIPNEGATIECIAAFIQGIFGIGGETFGEIKVMAKSPEEVLSAEQITAEYAGKILIGGSMVTIEALQKAVEVGVKGIVVGGIEEDTINKFLGYRIGVAITGEEEKGITLIVTEGFSKMNMSDGTFNLLAKFNGKLACISGATQIRAGVIRPEIIIPRDDIDEKTIGKIGREDEIPTEGMRPGLPIRIIREPYFGAIGRVSSLPVELQIVETESEVRVLEAELANGKKVIVARANVELIEE
ncbi:MAG: hypothetical protein QG670_1554 [Thermoproteota archaeon]|nr:hypothetical protein [Thermoproteota archaeon]